MSDSLRIAAQSLAALGLALAGCGASSAQQAPPPPPMSASGPAQPPANLPGGPSGQPPAAAPGQAGSAALQASATMQPIPNPEDMTPEQRFQLYGDVYASTVPVHALRPHRRNARPPSPNSAAGSGPGANPAANHGVPASAAVAIAGASQRPIPGQPGAGLDHVASTPLPSSVGASARAATAGSAAGSQRGAPPANGAPAKPQGKLISAGITFLIAVVALIAAARNSGIRRPRRRSPDYGAGRQPSADPPTLHPRGDDL